MAIEVTLPKLGLTMEEGTLEEWLVNDGDLITVGTPLLRLATDKIDVDVEAEADGIMARAVPNGTTLPPGAVLGWLLAPGEVACAAEHNKVKGFDRDDAGAHGRLHGAGHGPMKPIRCCADRRHRPE